MGRVLGLWRGFWRSKCSIEVGLGLGFVLRWKTERGIELHLIGEKSI